MMQSIAQHNYVISLTTAQDRRKHISEEFGKQDIPFEFFDAITPDLIEEKAKEFDIDISHTTLTKGEIACALSHIALWHLAKEKNLDYICIFEDDIYLGENAKHFLANEYISPQVDIIKLEKNFDIIITDCKPEKVYFDRSLYRLRSTHSGTAGYLLTQKGIKNLIGRLNQFKDIEIDNLIFNLFLKDKDYIVWQLLPALCIQDAMRINKKSFETTIAGRDDRNKKLKRKSTLLQKIKKECFRLWRRIKFLIRGRKVTFL